MRDQYRRIEIVRNCFITFVFPRFKIKSWLRFTTAFIELRHDFHRFHQPLVAFLARQHRLVRNIEHTAVMRLQEIEPYNRRIKSFVKKIVTARYQFHRQDVVSGWFAHSLAIHGKHVGVQPVIHGRNTVAGFPLRYFTFVVRKFKVHPATVYIEVFT